MKPPSRWFPCGRSSRTWDSRAHLVPPCTERQSVTADSWPYPETTVPARDSVPARPGEPGNMLLVPASATGDPAGPPAGPMVEVAREAVARSSPEEALRAVIEMAVESGPCDAANS